MSSPPPSPAEHSPGKCAISLEPIINPITIRKDPENTCCTNGTLNQRNLVTWLATKLLEQSLLEQSGEKKFTDNLTCPVCRTPIFAIVQCDVYNPPPSPSKKEKKVSLSSSYMQSTTDPEVNELAARITQKWEENQKQLTREDLINIRNEFWRQKHPVMEDDDYCCLIQLFCSKGLKPVWMVLGTVALATYIGWKYFSDSNKRDHNPRGTPVHVSSGPHGFKAPWR